MMKTNKRAGISDLLEGAVGPIKGGGPVRKRHMGSAYVSPEYSQSEIRHIDHYIDGIQTRPSRERNPFDPVAYMRGAA